jgi:hypothetical protein
MKSILTAGVLLMAFGAATAKLPPPDDAAKAKAAETKAKADWQAKVDAFLLCRAQDRVAAQYRRSGGSNAGTAATAQAAVPGAAPTAMPVAGTPPAAAAQPAAAGVTPVAAAAPPSCSDPGPFAYTPPEQKPLEVSGAHSPAPTAASPPSTNQPAATLQQAPGAKK